MNIWEIGGSYGENDEDYSGLTGNFKRVTNSLKRGCLQII